MTNTPTTYTNDLLALLLALQSPTAGTLSEDSKKKLKQLGTKLAVEPDDGEDIEDRLKTILQGNPDLKREHEKFLAQLANLTPEILLELLPTKEEREAVLSSRVPVTFSSTPSKPYHPSLKPELSNVAMARTAEVAFKHENPAEASKTLLQRVLEWLGKPGK
jgi:hypothetical protein